VALERCGVAGDYGWGVEDGKRRVQGGGQTGEQQADNRVALPGPEGLQVLRLKTGMLGDSRKHTRSKFFTIVEGEHKVAPAFT